MDRPTLIVNFKNYPEVLGDGAVRLAASAALVAEKTDVNLVVAPPTPVLSLVASMVKIPVFGQKVDDAEEGKSTGSVIPEALSAWGCSGSIINHSESRVPMNAVSRLVTRMKKDRLASCVCAEDLSEVSNVSSLKPEMIAIEPKDLIGTGIAVSKARPGLVRESVEAARKAGFRGKVLCGAGIVSGADVRAAASLGADGVLVASAVVKAKDWKKKILELSEALVR